MVNYKLGVYKNKKEAIEICLNSITNLNTNKIQNIDAITTEFCNEKELKLYLVNKRLISSDEKVKINIIYKYRGEYQKLPTIYKDEKKYLDPAFLNYKLKSMSSNTEFLEKLANHYSIGNAKYNPQGLNVSDIRIYLGDVRQCGYAFDSKLLSTALEDLYIKATTTINKNTGEVKVNYRGLRDLSHFIFRFEHIQELKKEKQNQELKKNKKEKEDILLPEYEQLNLFDLIESNTKKIWNFNDDEPIFPPNSEEEKQYNEYMENLPDECYYEDDANHYKK